MPPVDGWPSKYKTTEVAAYLAGGRLFLCLVIVVSEHISETESRQHKAHKPNQPFHSQHTPHLLSSFHFCLSRAISAQSFRKLPDSSEEHRVLRNRGPATYHLGDTPARLSTVTRFLPRSTFHVHLLPVERNVPWFPISRPVPRSTVAHFPPNAMPMVASFRRIWPSMFTSPASCQMRRSMAFPSRPIQRSTVSRFPPYKLILTHYLGKCNINIY